MKQHFSHLTPFARSNFIKHLGLFLIIFFLCVVTVLSGGCRKSPGQDSSPEASSTPPPTKPVHGYIVDISQLSPEEKLCALALQGLANRKGPKVILQSGESVRWNTMGYWERPAPQSARLWSDEDAIEAQKRYANIAEYWIDYCQRKGIADLKKVSLPELYKCLADDVKGAILYSRIDDDLSVVGTMAGLDDGVPMTPTLYRKMCEQTSSRIPIIFDVRSIYAGYAQNSEKRIEAHKWAIEHLLPRCDKTAAFSRDKTYNQDAHDTIIDVDLAIKNRWMIFDLTYLSKATAEGDSEYKPDPIWGYEPPDEALLIKILDSLTQPYPAVYGWGRPGESALIRRLALNNAVKICTGTGNASFLQAIPAHSGTFKQAAKSVEDKPLENKVYVCFAVNEGDTLKYLVCLGNAGAWTQPQRGTVPINWGMDPLLYEKFPGLVGHYYETATPNDYFFSATSGWGYLSPDKLPDDKVSVYANLVRQGGELADISYADIWWLSGLRSRNQFFPFLSASKMKGLTQWTDEQFVEFAPDGTPIIHSNFYYAYLHNEPEAVAEKIREAKERMGAPWFIFVYGGTPYFFSEVAKHLPAEDYKIVLMDEFFQAAAKARTQLEGRVLKVSKDEVHKAP